MSLSVHIISFDVPYPPNYGGVIDVYYKLVALHECGVKVILHCFLDKRPPSPKLEEICEEVCYYPRLTGFQRIFSRHPYIVASRRSDALRRRLLQDRFPILFEGLHTCGLIGNPAFTRRIKVYRESNIEHHYYFHLFKAERSFRNKLFFLSESLKLKRFQPNLRHAELMLAVSREDERYLKHQFPHNRVLYLPSFHRDHTVSSLPGKGSYILYQGKLSVPENIQAAEYIIKQVYTDSLPELIIAGMDPSEKLKRLATNHSNIRIIANPSDEAMTSLIQEAQVNLMVTAQPTGLKLKLLNALFQGRHCLVNPQMLAGTGLDEVCHVAETPLQFRKEIERLFDLPFNKTEITRREEILFENYSNKKNCKILVDTLTLLHEKDPRTG